MIEWLIELNNKCRSIADKARDALEALAAEDHDTSKRIQAYVRVDYSELVRIWEKVNPDKNLSGRLSDLARHIKFGSKQDYNDILKHDLPDVQRRAEQLALEFSQETPLAGFEQLLHPVIIEQALPQYKDGHLRDAVLNSVLALFGMIRQRTGVDKDGNALVGHAFSLENGTLVFSDIDTESGQNDQKGFMQILQGVYQGVRNVKAHTLNHDLNEIKAAQYLVMMSLLARRVEECKVK